MCFINNVKSPVLLKEADKKSSSVSTRSDMTELDVQTVLLFKREAKCLHITAVGAYHDVKVARLPLTLKFLIIELKVFGCYVEAHGLLLTFLQTDTLKALQLLNRT